jgi:hypothetical protein
MLINYILFLMTFLSFGGLALDTGLLELRRLRLQQAADAAAQEAMYEYARSDSTWITDGKAQTAMNGFTDGVNGVTVSIVNPPTSGTYAGNSSVIQATVTQSVNTLFMSLVKGGKSTVAGTAFAEVLPTCVWIMNDSGNSANGSLQLASTVLDSGCGVYVNTSSANSAYNLRVDFFATLNVSGNRIRVVGPATGNSSTGTITSQPKYGAAKKMDPLAYVTAPTLVSCTYNNISLPSGTYTISPGTYCGGMTLSHANVTLNPGLYIIAGGVNAWDSNIYGTGGVTLYFTKTSGSPSYSLVIINSDSTTGSYGVYLKAPTSSSGGGIPGVVIFADRNWVTHGSQGIQIVNNKIITDGFWYMPNTGLYMWIVQFGFYKYNGLVVDNLYQYSDGSYFTADYSDLGGVSPLHYEDGVLVQ